jgi:hypothetical protein
MPMQCQRSTPNGQHPTPNSRSHSPPPALRRQLTAANCHPRPLRPSVTPATGCIIAECGVCRHVTMSPCHPRQPIAVLYRMAARHYTAPRRTAPHRTAPHPHCTAPAHARGPHSVCGKAHGSQLEGGVEPEACCGAGGSCKARHMDRLVARIHGSARVWIRSRGASLRVRLTNLVRPRALGWRAEMRGIVGNAETWCSVGQRQPMAACARLVFLDVYARSIRKRQSNRGVLSRRQSIESSCLSAWSDAGRQAQPTTHDARRMPRTAPKRSHAACMVLYPARPQLGCSGLHRVPSSQCPRLTILAVVSNLQ